MPKRATGLAGSDASEASYLRRKKPVQVRRNVWKKSGSWLIRAGIAIAVVTVGVSTALSVDTYLREASTFRLPGEQPVRISGLRYAKPEAVRAILDRDEGRSLYEVALDDRRRQIEELTWVKQAALRRNWPRELWVQVEERVPVAFVRFPRSNKKNRGSAPMLVDSEGVFLDAPEGHRFVFPVATGINPSMPPTDRTRRVKLYQALLSGLDASEPFYSSRISEVDVADPRNAKVKTAFDGEMIELQMGEKNFRHRFQVFLKYFETWKKEFGRVRSVDLRYKGVVVTK